MHYIERVQFLIPFFLAAHCQNLSFTIITTMYKVRLRADQLDLVASICSSPKKRDSKSAVIAWLSAKIRILMSRPMIRGRFVLVHLIYFFRGFESVSVQSRRKKASSLSLSTLPTYLSQTRRRIHYRQTWPPSSRSSDDAQPRLRL